MPDLIDRFLFEVQGLSQTLRVARFAGQEGLSELFHFELILMSEEGALSFNDVIAQPALMTMRADDDHPRLVHGIVSRFEQGDMGKRLTAYRLTLVPKAWKLQHRFDCRIFQELTAPEIIEQVLSHAGLSADADFRLSLQGTYATREYCVQYRESDFAFISRLMEEEGIYYFFEHHEDKHVMVLGDKTAAHPPIEGDSSVVFRPPLGALKQGEHIFRFHYAEEVRTGKITLRDYDFKKPSLLLESGAEGSAFSELEAYDYPGDYQEPSGGDGLARIRLEERQALQKTGDGESGCARLLSGHRFTLIEHNRETFNREYLVTHVDHEGLEPTLMDHEAEDATRYDNRFRCIPADVPFRPPMITPRPTIKGIQTAIVVGPQGEEIYTDAFGRVKVQFHWDRLGKKDDKSSCFLRVSQVWAGESWGSMHVPRVKQEVLVDFLEGDPDRPLIVGRVYHGTNVPPYALPANKTRSTIKSSSTPGGEGWNELRFEDKKGSEEIYLHGQKDWTISIENDKNQQVGHDETRKVVNNRTLEVGVDQAEKIGKNETLSVGNDRSKSVGNDEAESIKNDRSIEVGHDHTESIGNNLSLSVGKVKTEEVGEDSSETVGKKRELKVGSTYSIEVSSDMSTKVSASQTEEIELDKTVKVGSKITIQCGAAKVVIDKSGSITIEGKTLSVKCDGPVSVSAPKVEVSSSGEVKVTASGKVEVKGSGPMSLEASGPVKVKGANVGIN
jgi:type VI secretion system secreted protein VgrG